MPSLDPTNFGAWACCSITHAQPWSSKFWSLRHVVYLTQANLDPPKFWSLRWVLYVTHAQPRSSKFRSWAWCIIYTCKTLVLQLSELRGHVVCITHAQPLSSKFWSLGMSLTIEHCSVADTGPSTCRFCKPPPPPHCGSLHSVLYVTQLYVQLYAAILNTLLHSISPLWGTIPSSRSTLSLTC